MDCISRLSTTREKERESLSIIYQEPGRPSYFPNPGIHPPWIRDKKMRIKCVTNKGQVKTAITGPAKHMLLSDSLHLRARLQKLWSVFVVFAWAPPSLSLRPPFICYFNYDYPSSSLTFGTEWLFQMIPHMEMDNAKKEE